MNERETIGQVRASAESGMIGADVPYREPWGRRLLCRFSLVTRLRA